MQLIDRFWKYASAAARPAFWPALRRGVMPGIEHLRALEPLNPASIVDVGANKGQFSTAVRYLFPNARIYAFEPLSSEFARYRHVVSGAVETFDCALGDSEKTIDFFVTSRRDSSS